jgi:hypothetical protein
VTKLYEQKGWELPSVQHGSLDTGCYPWDARALLPASAQASCGIPARSEAEVATILTTPGTSLQSMRRIEHELFLHHLMLKHVVQLPPSVADAAEHPQLCVALLLLLPHAVLWHTLGAEHEHRHLVHAQADDPQHNAAHSDAGSVAAMLQARLSAAQQAVLMSDVVLRLLASPSGSSSSSSSRR